MRRACSCLRGAKHCPCLPVPLLQVYVSYGTQGNDSLVQLYGFAEQDNPADEYNLTRMMQVRGACWIKAGGGQPLRCAGKERARRSGADCDGRRQCKEAPWGAL